MLKIFTEKSYIYTLVIVSHLINIFIIDTLPKFNVVKGKNDNSLILLKLLRNIIVSRIK